MCIRDRCQVAGGSKGTAVVDNWHDVIIEKIEDALHGDNLYAAMSQWEGVGFEKHHQFDDDGADFFAYAASMAFYQVLLEGSQFIGRYIFSA